MAIELGQAYVQIMPSAKGISGSIQKQIDPEALSAGKSAGGRLAAGLSHSLGKAGATLTKAITLPAVAAATAAGGIVAAFGWGRLKGLDTAQAQLKGLGYATEDVERISDQVVSAVSTGMTTLAEGTAVAAGALAAGVSEGAELEKYIKLVGDAAVGANRPVNDMAQIFNRVQGSGKLMTQELNMIEQGMPGFAAAMSKSLGVPQEEFRKMVTEGKVSSEQFLDVMDDFAGGMAEAYANSWDGMVANTKAYIGILGENLLGGVFEQSKESIAEFMEFLKSDKIQAWAEQAGQKLGQFFSDLVGKIKEAIDWWANLDDGTKKLILTIAGIAIAIGPVLTIISKVIAVVTTAGKVFGALKGAAIALGGAIGAITAPVAIAIAAVAAIIAIGVLLYKNWDTVKEYAQKLGEWISQVWNSIKEWTVETWNGIKDAISEAWNNIKEAVSGAIESVKETITNIWNSIKDTTTTVWNAIKDAISSVWNAIKTVIDTVINFIKDLIVGYWTAVFNITSAIWNGIKDAISSVWNGIKTTVDTVINLIKTIISGAWNSIKETTSSVWNGIKDTVSNIMNSIKDTFSNIFNSLKGIVVSAFNSVKEAVKTGMTNAWETVTGFFDKFKSAGRKIVTSIADGIRSAIGVVTDAISGVVQSIRNFLPFSPAKEGPLKDLDKLNFGGTISLGIDEGAAEIERAMEKMLTMPKIKHQLETTEGGSRGRGIVQNITINSPKELSPSETARQIKNASRNLAMGW